jgi:signal-transduction protein with cAMP-binding, CBS, and nucleotidyltransferase domain
MQVMEPQEVLAKLADYPLRVFEEGDVVLSEGSSTGRLLFLKHGAVDVMVDDIEVVRADEPGAVFGDVALLLDHQHKADVRAVQPSSFHVIEDAEKFLDAEPAVLLYIAQVLARRLDAVNHLLIEGRSRAAEAGPRGGFVAEMYHRIVGALQIRVPREP